MLRELEDRDAVRGAGGRCRRAALRGHRGARHALPRDARGSTGGCSCGCRSPCGPTGRGCSTPSPRSWSTSIATACSGVTARSANTLFMRDGQIIRAWLVDAETAELVHATLSDGQRNLDLEIMVENVLGGLLDVAARLELPDEAFDQTGGRRPKGVVDRATTKLWAILHEEPVIGLDEGYHVEARVRRLNELGFAVDEVRLETVGIGRPSGPGSRSPWPVAPSTPTSSGRSPGSTSGRGRPRSSSTTSAPTSAGSSATSATTSARPSPRSSGSTTCSARGRAGPRGRAVESAIRPRPTATCWRSAGCSARRRARDVGDEPALEALAQRMRCRRSPRPTSPSSTSPPESCRSASASNLRRTAPERPRLMVAEPSRRAPRHRVPSRMATVTLDDVNKVYDNGFHAIHDLSLDIADGEFLVLVGPSGCGKSTALRMVAGLETITGGEMRIGDRVVNDVEPKDRDIAMVFQNYALYPHMTVFDNIGFALKLARVPKDEIDSRVRKAAADPRARAVPGPQARPALRRPAPAGGHGPGHRAPAGGVPDGRAAVQPRRQAAGADAGRDRRASSATSASPRSTSRTTRSRP